MASLISQFEHDHFTLFQTTESFKIGQALDERLSTLNFSVFKITSLVSQHYLAKWSSWVGLRICHVKVLEIYLTDACQ